MNCRQILLHKFLDPASVSQVLTLYCIIRFLNGNSGNFFFFGSCSYIQLMMDYSFVSITEKPRRGVYNKLPTSSHVLIFALNYYSEFLLPYCVFCSYSQPLKFFFPAFVNNIIAQPGRPGIVFYSGRYLSNKVFHNNNGLLMTFVRRSLHLSNLSHFITCVIRIKMKVHVGVYN